MDAWTELLGGRASGQCTARDGMLAAAALPFEPQRLAPWRRQWFEGWFVRFIDHATGLSVALILGSMRLPGRSASAAGAFDEHLLVLAFRDASGRHDTQHVILGEHGAWLRGGGAGRLPDELSSSRPPRWEWRSATHGFIRGAGDDLFLDVSVGGARLRSNVSGPRVVWDEREPNRAGPEGWLGRTGLLPCHYFVHSFASPATYDLAFPANGFPATQPPAGQPPASPNPSPVSRLGGMSGFRLGSRPSPPVHMTGHGLTHIERNYGDAFPRAWVWAQASAPPPAAAQLVLTGGQFVIGPIETQSFVIGLRAAAAALDGGHPPSQSDGAGGSSNGGRHAGSKNSPAALVWNFRSTDGDAIHHERDACAGRLFVEATSRGGGRRLRVRLSAPPPSFGARIPVPTAGGFSAEPGCRESYNATADITAWASHGRKGGGAGQGQPGGEGAGGELGRDWVPEWPLLRLRVPMAVLEFGGSYQCAG
jgi:hypothetical protein